MYERILVPVEHTEYDDVILRHVRKLARACNDASIVLIHVADGWAARNINQLDIEAIADDLEKEGYEAEAILAGGDPAKEIAACAEREKCDLIAMATHGHHGIADVIHGSVASELRHITMVPVLMVRAKPGVSPASPRPVV
jgi:nucleotide-binding universal stress UspA family protein